MMGRFSGFTNEELCYLETGLVENGNGWEEDPDGYTADAVMARLLSEIEEEYNGRDEQV
ncbi:MAG: hypothetical protein LUE27_06815 [Clostridia bacterium]|nr:hypothetical protein [Clostridia bacterium]